MGYQWFFVSILLVVGSCSDEASDTSVQLADAVAGDSRGVSDGRSDDTIGDTSTSGADVFVADIVSLDVSARGDDGFATDASISDTGPITSDVVSSLDVGAEGDASQGDAGANITPFGVILGTCGELVEVAGVDEPSIFSHTFEFDGTPFDDAELSSGGAEMFYEENAGGSSKCSEVFSYEVISRCFDADLYKTETEIVYETREQLPIIQLRSMLAHDLVSQSRVPTKGLSLSTRWRMPLSF